MQRRDKTGTKRGENRRTVAQLRSSHDRGCFDEIAKANSCRADNGWPICRIIQLAWQIHQLDTTESRAPNCSLTFSADIQGYRATFPRQKQPTINRYVSQNNRGWRTFNNKRVQCMPWKYEECVHINRE